MKARLLALASVVVLVAGCGVPSQVATLQPVAGDAITQLNIAANDVLINNEVNILVAPVCEFTETAYDCAGTTVDKQKIVVEAEGAKPTDFTVRVGSETLYDGPIADVIKKAGQSR